MVVGMLWFDDDKQRPVNEKIRLAMDYYTTKYGKVANVCLVALGTAVEPIEGVVIRPDKTIAKDHFLIGNM